MEALLQSHSIYELGNYGWKGPDEYDNEMIGHAMWQTDSLYFRFLDAHFSATHSNGPPPPILEPWQQFLVASGGDFEGLLEASRISIGLALLQQSATERDHYSESSLFQVHLISSLMLLGSASDRLRDLLVAGVFRVNTDQYESARGNSKNAKRYDKPFVEAAESFATAYPSWSDSFNALPSLAKRIWGFRKVRNDVVHKTATELGRQQRDFAKRTTAAQVDKTYSYEKHLAYQEKFEDEHRKRFKDDTNIIVDWYKVLIDASNHVFIVENRLRHHREKATEAD